MKKIYKQIFEKKENFLEKENFTKFAIKFREKVIPLHWTKTGR